MTRLFIILCFLSTVKGFGQNLNTKVKNNFYIQIADYYFQCENYVEASDYFTKADKEALNYMMAYDYKKVAHCTYRMKSYDKTKYFLNKAIINGLSLDEIQKDSILNYFVSYNNFGKKVAKNYQANQDKYQAQLDMSICEKIKSLCDLDQFVRTYDIDSKFDSIDQICKNKISIVTDSIYIFEELSQLLSEKKLTKSNIGRYCEDLVLLLRHQAAYSKHYKQLLPKINELLRNQVLQPSHYAFIADGYYLFNEKQMQLYGTQLRRYEPQREFSEFSDITKVDSDRLLLGLVPLKLRYSPSKCILPKDYISAFDINSFINYININYNDINYIFK